MSKAYFVFSYQNNAHEKKNNEDTSAISIQDNTFYFVHGWTNNVNKFPFIHHPFDMTMALCTILSRVLYGASQKYKMKTKFSRFF